ncbi:MAG: UDP-4-amino-4,6-dideoxy-N-acetyl-beta-L-altrosamine N-acetyltransferase [Lachnospiraceae bacterium]|nr:UDP-4-amino-4,6-dideoxy-N-acetyl-beta-L-altrosamine N-acetyltransferase [Lachnospiraceae bacterium]
MKFRAVELNRLDEKTIADIRIWRNQEFVRRNMFQTHIITEEEHRKYIDKLKMDPNRGLFVFFLDNEPFGVFQYEVNPKEHTVTNGNYLIDETYQMMGYGTIMYYMIGVIEYTCLKVEKICAEVVDTNKDALNMQIRMGGTVEKILKDHVILDGVKHDVYQFSYPLRMWDENSRIAKIARSFIDEESLEDMLVL